MTDEPLREVAAAPGHGRRALAGLRYAPLVLLMLCVVAAALVGRHERNADRASHHDSSSAAAAAVASLPAICAPPVNQHLERQPWRDDTLRPASRQVFDAAVAREHPGHITGRNGSLFFNDGQAQDFSQAVGRTRLRTSQVEAWDRYLSGMQASAEAHGGQFYVMIAPAKWDVYPEELPAWAQKLRGTDSLDLLMTQHPELPFIDVRSALRTSDHPTYSPLNSHWTDYGGYIAWKSATACLREADPANAALRVPAISGVDLTPDLNEFAADGVVLPAKPTRTAPVYVAPHPATSVTRVGSGDPVEVGADDIVDMLLLPVQTHTRHAQSDKTLLVLRDSTGSALSPLWSQSFAHTVQYQHPVGGMGAPVDVARLVDDYRPDITIFTMTERYLVFGPPPGSAKP